MAEFLIGKDLVRVDCWGRLSRMWNHEGEGAFSATWAIGRYEQKGMMIWGICRYGQKGMTIWGILSTINWVYVGKLKYE